MEPNRNDWINALYYHIGYRTESDWTASPGMAIFLSLITCGIYSFYLIYKLVERRDRHFTRMANVANLTIALLREKAESTGETGKIATELQRLDYIQRGLFEQSRERGAGMWLLIAVLTSGIGTLIIYYLLTEDMGKHAELEQDFFTTTSSALKKLGLAGAASQAPASAPQRNTVLYVILTIVTLGIFALYWLFVLIDDGNSNFSAQAPWEDFIYTALAR